MLKNKELFKNKNFTLLMIASFISTTGTIMQNTALSLYVLDITQSSTKFATVLSLALLPRLILSPFCGVISDLVNKKKLMICLDLISSLVILILGILSIQNEISLNSIYIMVITLSIILALDSPTRASMIRVIVKTDLSDAYATMSFIDSIQYLISPMLGAIIYSLFGLKFILVLNAITFIFSAFIQTYICMPNIALKDISLLNFKNDFIDGFVYVKNNKKLWYLAILIMFYNFFSYPLFTVGTGYIAKLQFQVSNEQFSFIEVIGVIASLIGPLLYSLIKEKISLQNLFQLSILICATLISFMSVVSMNLVNNLFMSYLLYLMLYFLFNLVEGPLNISMMTLIQSSIDVEYAGRSNGILSTMFLGMAPLGQLCFGVLFDYMYIAIPYLITSIAYVVLVLIYRRKIQNN